MQKLAHIAVGALWLLALLAPGLARAQSPDAAADLAARINRERISRGLAPYALNAQLTGAAQSHANDIAATGSYSHTGSDGSTVFDRVARTSFGAYSWGRRLGENWAWYPNAAAAMAAWMDSPPHRGNVLHSLYREIGVGIAPSRGNTIFVVDFGVEPNVLPVFIDGIDGKTNTPAVTLTLTSEDVMPNGDGRDSIGRASQIQISNAADFAGAHWQAFAPQVPWTLPPGDGLKTIYVKYRDPAGRVAVASDSILYSETFAATATRTPRPTWTRTRTPTVTQTAVPSDTPAVTPVDTATLGPAQTATAAPTDEPLTRTPTRSPLQSALALPSPAPVALDVTAAQDVNPLELGGLGIALMLLTLALVKYLSVRNQP